MTSQKRTKLHIEFMRIIAIFFVLYNHTNEAGYTLYFFTDKPALKPFLMVLSNLCVIAVPLFFMISGALLLSKEESYRDLYLKRVLRIIVAFLLSSFAYRLFYYVLWGAPMNLIPTFLSLPFTWAYFSQWYIYSYLAFLIMLPLLRKMVKNMGARDFRYVLVAQLLIVGVLPMLVYRFSGGNMQILSYFNPTIIMTESIVYALMGYYLEHVVKKSTYENPLNIIICLAASAVALFAIGEFVNYKMSVLGTLDGNWLSDTQKMLAIIPTMSVYFIAKYVFDMHEFRDGTKKILRGLGGSVFGIFLIEGILREATFTVYQKLQPAVGVFPACILWLLFALAIGFLVIGLIRKIPGVNKII